MKTKITTIFFCAILITTILAITASANEPPTAPSIDGPASGKIATPIM